MVIIQFFMLCLGFFSHQRLAEWRMTGHAQGTTYHILYYSRDSVPQAAVEGLLNQIDSSLSIYKPYSLISRFNEEKRGVISDRFLKLVVNRSMEVYADSRGKFDITVLPLMKFWGFGNKARTSMPDSGEVARVMNCVGSEKIFFIGDSLVKTKPCLQIDVNGIAQGYSVDLLAELLDRYKVKNYLVELGGEIKARGKKPNGDRFKIELESADSDKKIRLKKGAITTSGSYRQFVEINNKKLPHLINPLTGYPLESKNISVTVWAKDAITADAYDNVLMAMTIPEIFSFVKKRPQLDARIIYLDEGGELKDTATRGFQKMME